MSNTKKNIDLHVFPLGRKKVLWISSHNKYILAEPLAAEVISLFANGASLKKIKIQIQNDYSIPVNESNKVIRQLTKVWKDIVLSGSDSNNIIIKEKQSGSAVYSKKYYLINNIRFYVEYETADAEWYNHPKFAHLEVENSENIDHYLRVEDSNNNLSLWVNGNIEGIWEKAENHFLSGKFSMKIIEKIYDKNESQWMGVFHAAGISDESQCILFFGDSGDGKSTLSALLMAAGFNVLSDDFLPVESKTRLVYQFPAAISIKKKAYDLLSSIYPKLKDTEEFENHFFNKTYRFLTPNKLSLDGVPCKAIIRIKYDPKVDFSMKKTSAEDNFTQLVPDSWIYQSPENVFYFVDWFGKLDHYQLTYSNNEKMISIVKDLFKN